MQFNGKLMKQTWENGEKTNFEPDFGSFGPNLDHKNFVRELYINQMLDMLQTFIVCNVKEN